MNQWITSSQCRLLWCAEKEKVGLLTMLSGFGFLDQKVRVNYKRKEVRREQQQETLALRGRRSYLNTSGEAITWLVTPAAPICAQ
jgi:hypothetical protein